MQFSESEINWLKNNFPELKFNQTNEEINGVLHFSASYDQQKDKVIFTPDKKDKTFIESSYKIKILFSSKHCFQIIDTEDIIRKSAKKKKINIDYIHINKGKYASACIAGPERFKELKEEFKKSDNKIKKTIYLAIQFFYHQTYVLKFKKEPWKGFSHGKKGIQEEIQDRKNNLYNEKKRYYKENISSELKSVLIKGKVGVNEKCPCGSGKKYKKCHYHEVQNTINFIGGWHLINLFNNKE